MSGIAGGSLFIGKPLIVFYGDRRVAYAGAYDNSTDAHRNDLTVTAQLKDSNNSSVSGSSLSLTLVASDKGDRQGAYEGTLPGTLSLTSASTYFLELTARDSSATLLDFRRIEYIAQYETSS